VDEALEALIKSHDRMSVIFDPTADALRLDPGANSSSLHFLLMPYPGEKLEAFPISPWVSAPKHQRSRCLEPVGA
jgi:putative SOS response-associated peptidase YedK